MKDLKEMNIQILNAYFEMIYSLIYKNNIFLKIITRCRQSKDKIHIDLTLSLPNFPILHFH